ncbi:MAG: glycine cleavage system protein H, partial [Dehalococcoidia bacterium]
PVLINLMFLIFVASLGIITCGLIFNAVKGVLPRKARLLWPRTAGLAEGVCYHHPGHTWAQAAGRGLAAVGLDELGSKVIGRIDAIKLPRVGELVRQGETAWSLTHKSRSVDLVSPVTGSVVEVNEALERDPGLINRFPYTQGWVLKTQMRRIKEDLKSLFTSALARRLMDLSKAWICYSFSQSPPYPHYRLTYQDGGELVEGIGDRLNDEEWGRLKKKLFLSH